MNLDSTIELQENTEIDINEDTTLGIDGLLPYKTAQQVSDMTLEEFAEWMDS